MGDLEGKNVLLTGAGGGIGRATALRLVDAGAVVTLTDIDAEAGERVLEEVVSAGGDAVFVPADLIVESEVAQLVDDHVRRHGTLDVALNIAGHEGPSVPTADYDPKSFRDTLDTNLLSMFHCLRHELAVMRAQRAGSVVNMGSILSHAATAESVGYTAAKHAVVGMTRTAALEMAPIGVRVNAICPGYVLTPMTLDRGHMGPGSECYEEVRAQIPLGRFAEPSEIAQAVVWMASSAASYLVGQALIIDGGYLAH